MKTTARHHLTPVGVATVKADHSHTAEGLVCRGVAPLGSFGSFSEVNTHLPEDPVVLSQLLTQEGPTCMLHRLVHELELFTAALFVNAQNTRNPV